MKTTRHTVKIRRELAEVDPKAEQVDGKTYEFREGWKIQEDESSLYVGEMAMIPHDDSYPLEAPIWIASGDLCPDISLSAGAGI